MWNSVTDTFTIKLLMDLVNSFHDSCLKEIRYISGAYVDGELAMIPTNISRKLSVIIQRQSHNHSVVELEFNKLKLLKLVPLDEKYTCEIHSATLLLDNGLFYWFDCGGMQTSDFDGYDGVSICAEGLRWRTICDNLGSKDFFERRDEWDKGSVLSSSPQNPNSP